MNAPDPSKGHWWADESPKTSQLAAAPFDLRARTEEKVADLAKKAQARATKKAEEAKTGQQLLDLHKVNLLSAENDEVPNLIEDLILDEEVNLLGGHGGVGKSMQALQAAVAVAIGAERFLSAKSIHRKARVLYYSAEDGAKRLRRRLRRICDHMGTTLDAVSEGLAVVDATELDVLFGESVEDVSDTPRAYMVKVMGSTAAYDQLQRMVETYDPDLLIVDNASDTFDGEEIKRRDVRAFVRSLLRIHPRRRIAVLLLVHFNRQDARGDKNNDIGYSGNSAWHNSCRGRSYLVEDRDTKELRLVFMKNQDGPLAEPLVLQRIEGGLLQLQGTYTPNMIDRKVEQSRAVLALIQDYRERGKLITTSHAPQSKTGAWAVLNGDPSFPRGLDRKGLEALMRDMERLGVLTTDSAEFAGRHKRDVWRVVDHAAPSAPGCAK